MKFTSFKQILANFLLMGEFFALFFLLCAAIQGSLPLLAALGYAAGSFFVTNLLASLLVSISSPRRPVPRSCRKPSVHPTVRLAVVSEHRRAA